MTPSEVKKAKENSARLAALSPSKKRILSPFSPKRPLMLSQQLDSLGVARKPKIIRKVVLRKTRRSPFSLEYEAYKTKDGAPGQPGKDGHTPTRDELVALIRPLIEELKPSLEIDEDTVRKIIDIMHSLPENDKLEVSKGIRNASSFIYGSTKYQTAELMHGGGSGSTGTIYYTPTGTVNASNTIFTVTGQPSSVISDGITYFEGFGYSYNLGLNQITMDIAPSQFIKYSL